MQGRVLGIQEVEAIIRLLDDSDLEVQQALGRRLLNTDGDLSHHIAALGVELNELERGRLSNFLLPARRKILESEWAVPQSGLWTPSDDWDAFEHLLSLISDFLHDGIQLRASLTDQLDELAADAEAAGATSIDKLREYLFGGGRFRGNKVKFYLPNNSDLNWVISEGKGNPLSLALLFMMVGQRLGLEIHGCSFPGHFLASVGSGRETVLIDCYSEGEQYPMHELLQNSSVMVLKELKGVKFDVEKETVASFAEILRRLLADVASAYAHSNDGETSELFNRLRASLASERSVPN